MYMSEGFSGMNKTVWSTIFLQCCEREREREREILVLPESLRSTNTVFFFSVAIT